MSDDLTMLAWAIPGLLFGEVTISSGIVLDEVGILAWVLRV